MLPVLLLLTLIAVLRLGLLWRQRTVLRDAESAYARGLVTQRVMQQLWQQAWPCLLLLMLPSIAAFADRSGAVMTLFALVLAGWFWELPPKLYKVFGLDARHGMNRMSPAAFLHDQGIQLLMFAALALPATAVALEVMAQSGAGIGAGGWLPLWAIGWGGWATLRWVRPRYVAPLLDAVEPLPEGDLRSRMERLLQRCGVRHVRLFMMRSSKRSIQANAKVSGGLSAPRIVLSDTLIATLQPDEIEAVVAHELGHLQRGHLNFQLLMLGAVWLPLAAVAALLTAAIEPPAAMLAVAWALLPSLWFFAQPLTNYFYRRFEFEADAAAAETSSGRALARALRHLTRNNRNAPVADLWYERVYHTHPATSERLNRLERA